MAEFCPTEQCPLCVATDRAEGSCGVSECNLASVYETEHGPRCWGHRAVTNTEEEQG